MADSLAIAHESMAQCEFLVEGNDFAYGALYKEFQAQTRIPQFAWNVDQRRGGSLIVGHIAGRPVVIAVTVTTICGFPVLFWYPTSAAVDHDLIKAYLEKHCPLAVRGADVLHWTDANNFWSMMADLAERFESIQERLSPEDLLKTVNTFLQSSPRSLSGPPSIADGYKQGQAVLRELMQRQFIASQKEINVHTQTGT